MKVTLESTEKMIQLVVNGTRVDTRLWQGATVSGIPVVAFVIRIATPVAADQAEFQRELFETAPLRPDIEAIPSRLVI